MQVLPIRASEICDQSRWAFIVGAPRCGTTSLSRYLAKHPDVCFSRLKEPHFFAAADLRNLSDHELRLTVQRDYANRFFQSRSSSSLLAEGSVTYLYVPEKLEPILRLWPNAKFIIGVRNPLTMIPSLHRRLCFIGDETVLDFRRAWKLVPERRQGRSIPRRCADPRWLDYWEAGRHGKYVGEFLSRIGSDRCFVYLFDELVSDPARLYRQVLSFLDLPDDGRIDFRRHRGSRGFKIGWLQRALMRPPGAMKALGSKGYRHHFSSGAEIESAAMKNALSLRKRVLAWNKAPAQPVHLDPELRSEMATMFRDDVAQLGELLNRDLSHWVDEPR